MKDPTLLAADLDSAPMPLRQPWQWCVGSGHALLALRADWQAQLTQAHRELGFRYIRFHGILDDDMGTLIDQDDQALYSFFNSDRIFDFLLSIGMKPVVELSFMPRMLASGNDIVFHYQGNVTPPRDLAQWSELITRLVSHWVERYGIEEVCLWPFECWNEPNLKAFWTGDQAAYFKLYSATARAIKAVDARLQVGGPASSGNEWLDAFRAHCEAENAACDFLSTHYYPTDPFGTVDSDTISQLADYPAGTMRKKALEARASAGKLALYYTEWSISSNPRDPMHDESFAAAFAARVAMSVDDVVDGYSYWTFSDIFEENYFPSVPFHGGFGMMTLYGVPKPIYRGFQMLRLLGDRQVEVSGGSDNLQAWVGIGAQASAPTQAVLINQAMPRHPVDPEPVTLRLAFSVSRVPLRVSVFRVDADHANPRQAWLDMGSPEYPKPAQVEALIAASLPRAEDLAFVAGSGFIEVVLVLAPQSINRVVVEWRQPSARAGAG